MLLSLCEEVRQYNCISLIGNQIYVAAIEPRALPRVIPVFGGKEALKGASKCVQ